MDVTVGCVAVFLGVPVLVFSSMYSSMWKKATKTTKEEKGGGGATDAALHLTLRTDPLGLPLETRSNIGHAPFYKETSATQQCHP